MLSKIYQNEFINVKSSGYFCFHKGYQIYFIQESLLYYIKITLHGFWIWNILFIFVGLLYTHFFYFVNLFPLHLDVFWIRLQPQAGVRLFCECQVDSNLEWWQEWLSIRNKRRHFLTQLGFEADILPLVPSRRFISRSRFITHPAEKEWPLSSLIEV